MVFLDSDYLENDQEAIKAIEAERKRIENEQANIISIIPAPQHNSHYTSKDTPPTETNLRQNNNITPSTIQQSTEESSNNKHTIEEYIQQLNKLYTNTDSKKSNWSAPQKKDSTPSSK